MFFQRAFAIAQIILTALVLRLAPMPVPAIGSVIAIRRRISLCGRTLTCVLFSQTALDAASSLTLFHMAMFMGSIALPIVATQELGGTNGDVGLIFSVCAFLEVLVMLVFVLRPSSSETRRWLSAGFVAFVLYFLVINWAPSVALFLLAQVLRAIGIGLVGYHGISYIQVLMPDRVGSAATLFSNTTNAGFLLAGSAAGGWAQLFGYRSMFLACAVLSGLGLLMLYLQSKLNVYCREADRI